MQVVPDNAVESCIPTGSLIQFIIAAALLIIAYKLAKSLAKPIIAAILIVAALLVIFGAVSLDTVKEQGKDMAGCAWSCASERLDSIKNAETSP